MKKAPLFIFIVILFLILVPRAVSFAEEKGEGAEKPGKMVLKIFKLKHRPPDSVIEQVSIYLSGEAKIATDNRTNSLLVRDYPENLAKIGELLALIDIPAPMVNVKISFQGVTTNSSSGIYGAAVKTRRGWRWVVNPQIASGSQSRSGTMSLTIISGTSGFIKVGERVIQPVWYYDYFLRHGYLRQGVVFQDVMTGFFVTPQVRGDEIEVSVAPGVSYYDGKKRNRIIVREMETTVMVKDGQSVALGVSDVSEKSNDSLIGQITGAGSSKKGDFFSMIMTVRKFKE